MLLVTGATGFLGRNLCTYLVSRGYRLRALVRPTSQCAFLRELGAEIVQGDVRDRASLCAATQGCRWVVHAAGKFRFWGRREDFVAVNVQGTANAIEAARCAGVERFVYISTLAVVGAPSRDRLLDENVYCRPRDDYQHSKLAAEGIVRNAAREKGLSAVILRPGAYYGPWGRYAFNQLFFEDPLRGWPVGVHHGKRLTFPVFVPDVTRVIQAALSQGRSGEIYNVADRSLTHREVHTTISRLAGLRAWRINPPDVALIGLARLWTFMARFTRREPHYSINMVPYIFSDWNTTSEKAQRELGFVATPFEEGAQQTVTWYRQLGIEPANWLGRLVLRLWRAPGV